MSLDHLYPTVIGDLRIERCGPADDYALALSRTDDGPEAVLVAAIPDGAACGIGEADGYARLLARADHAAALVRGTPDRWHRHSGNPDQRQLRRGSGAALQLGRPGLRDHHEQDRRSAARIAGRLPGGVASLRRVRGGRS